MLLFGREQELGATISALEDGIDVPMTRANCVILLGNIGSHSSGVVDGYSAVKKMRRHPLGFGASKNVHTTIDT